MKHVASKTKIDSTGREQTLRVVHREVSLNANDVGRLTFTVATNNTIHGNYSTEKEALEHYTRLLAEPESEGA